VIFRFADCLLDTERRELRRGGVLCALEPQVFDVLEHLVNNRHRVVSKTDLRNAVWKGRVVSEAALHTRVSAARNAIGDSGAEQHIILTLRTKGFRFIAPVREELSANWLTHASEANHTGRASLTYHPTIAVLPFTNSTADPRKDSVVDAMTESLIATLSKVGWLFVATHSSSFACKDYLGFGTVEAARKLGVRYLLDGNIRQIGGRIRITVQLIDGLTDFQIWASHYDQDVVDSFAVLEKICDKVVTALEPQLYLAEHLRIGRKTPESLNSWECIVRALSLMNSRLQTSVVSAEALLKKAISIDPESAESHSLLSIVFTLLVHMSWADRREVIPNALVSAHKALSLNPDLPWAHAALGYASIWNRPEESITPCQRAIALNPNFAVGHYFLALGSTYAGCYGNVLEHANDAERLARRDLLARGYAGAHDNVRSTVSFATEHYREGIDFARKAGTYIPSSPTAHRALLINLSLAGKFDEAQRQLQTLRRFAPKISPTWIDQNSMWSSREAAKRYVEAFRTAGLR
jgi:TolB-like protein/tetratricopeptide (TPR) repeat protein